MPETKTAVRPEGLGQALRRPPGRRGEATGATSPPLLWVGAQPAQPTQAPGLSPRRATARSVVALNASVRVLEDCEAAMHLSPAPAGCTPGQARPRCSSSAHGAKVAFCSGTWRNAQRAEPAMVRYFGSSSDSSWIWATRAACGCGRFPGLDHLAANRRG